MTRKLVSIASWFVANPVRIQMVIIVVLLAVALVAVLVPSAAVVAQDAVGGGH
jgi:uncharacterized membrane protein YhaH (DUF805 family)